MTQSAINKARLTPDAQTEPSAALSFHVRARGNAGAVARGHLELLRGKVDHRTLAKLRLLVSELVKRAATTVGRDMVRVSVTVSRGRVHAAVRDGASEEPRALDWPLFLVRRIADRSGVAGGVWFELDQR